MRALFLSFLALLISQANSWAQPLVPQTTAPTGKLTGRVIDASTQQAIEFATVSVFSLPDSAVVAGNVTDVEGKFLVEQIPLGKYYVHVDFLGYQSISIENIEFVTGNLQRDLGDVQLSIAAENLQVAEVTAETNTLQLNLDKKVFDVEKSALAQGGTAVDVLRTVPTLDVDMDGNVSLRGSQGVTVLINGKPSSLTGANRKAVLEQIPASMIKSVEIITNPSAKYDPDGKAGIINIVLKKNKLEGFSGNLSGSIGTLANKYNGTLGLNYRNQRINIFSTYNYNHYTGWQSNSSYRENRLESGTWFMSKDEKGIESNRTHFAKLGMDIYLNDKHTLSMMGSITPSLAMLNTEIDYQNLDENEVLVSSLHRVGVEQTPSLNAEANLSYSGEFKTPEQKLDVSFNFSRGRLPRSFGTYHQQLFDAEGKPTTAQPFVQHLLYIDQNTVLDGQLDYVHPFAKIGGQLETGWNSTLRLIDNNFVSEYYSDRTQTLVNDTTQSNRFGYNEQVHAAYITFGQKIKKFSYQVGLRAEQVFTTASLANTEQVFRNNYFSLYPSAHFSYEFPKEHQLQLSYSRRVQRPFLEALNPFISYTDPYNIHEGNPYLLPEYTHSVQLEYMKYWEKATLTASIYFQHSTNVLRRMLEVRPDGVSRVYYTNFAFNNQYGTEIVATYNPFKWWRMQASVNVFSINENAANIDADLKQNAVWGFLNGSMTFIIPKGFEAQINCFYRSPLKLVIGKITSMTRLSMAVSKSFLKKQLTVSLRLEDPFHWQQFGFELSDKETYTTTGKYLWESRVLWLSVNWNFGKMDMGTRQRMRQGIRNGGGGGGGGF